MSLGDHAPVVTRHFPAGGSTMGCICGWEVPKVPSGLIDHEVAYAAHVDADCDSGAAVALASKRVACVLNALSDQQRLQLRDWLGSWWAPSQLGG